MARTTAKRQPQVIAVLDISSSPEPQERPITSPPPIPSGKKPKASTSKNQHAVTPAPFTLVSPPPSPVGRTSTKPRPKLKNRQKTLPETVIEISDSSDDEPLFLPGSRKGPERDGLLLKAKGKDRARDVGDDETNAEPLFLPTSDPHSPSHAHAKIPSSSTRESQPSPLRLEPDNPDYGVASEERKKDEKGKGRAIDTPEPPQYDHNDPDFDDFWADEAPLFVLPPPRPHVPAKEPTQEPTPPAQNPTPPPPPPPAARDEHAAQLEAIGVAADMDMGIGVVNNDDDDVFAIDFNAFDNHPDDDDHPPIPEAPIDIDDNVDPSTVAVAAILEIIPEIEPDHLLALVEQHLPTYGPAQIVEFLVQHLFENPGYPRVTKGKGKERAEGSSGKRKSMDGQQGREGLKKAKIDYASVDRAFMRGADYNELARSALQAAFPFIPVPYIRRELMERGGLYAPTHLFLLEEEKRVENGGERRYTKKNVASPASRKGKGRALQDDAFDAEKKWLDAYLESGHRAPDEPTATNDAEDDNNDDDDLEDDGTFIECGCCFSSYPFERMAQCPDAHLFCRSCLRRYAETQLGGHNPALTCMHSSGCKLAFAESELARLLPPKLLSLYERLKQQKELKDANLEGLEECPFCDWACVVEVSVEEDKLFRCGNEEGGCGAVSCRMCRKADHLPKSCKEMEEDKHLDGRLAIEEAMTKALMRNCPKCQKAFIKENGCNKMTCTNCRALSCYVCRALITGYEHFHQNDPRNAGSSSKNDKCPLWDNLDQRHADEVKQAYQKALDDYKAAHPDVEVDKDLKVDLPKSPPKAAPGALPAGYLDPAALAAAGGGGAGAFAVAGAGGAFAAAYANAHAHAHRQHLWGVVPGAGGGWGGGAGGWGAVVLPPVPVHVRVEPLAADLVQAENRTRAAVVKVQDAQRRLDFLVQRENAIRLEMSATAAVRQGVSSIAAIKRAKLMAGAGGEEYRQRLSAIVTERAAQEVRLDNARVNRVRLEAEERDVRDRLTVRRRMYEEWRVQAMREAEREQAVQEARRRLEEEGRLREVRHRQMMQERAEARAEAVAEMQMRLVLAQEQLRAAMPGPAGVGGGGRQNAALIQEAARRQRVVEVPRVHIPPAPRATRAATRAKAVQPKKRRR